MKAKILVDGTEAYIGLETEMVWVSEDEDLARDLNNVMPLNGLSGACPHRALYAAKHVVSILGGEVVDFDETPYQPGRVY